MKKIFAAVIFFCLLAGWGLIFSAPASEAMLEQGIEALKAGNYSSAELIFRRLVTSDEAEIKDMAWFYLAQSIFYQKNYRSSIYEFTSYLNKCKTLALCQESRYWLGESYYYLKEYNTAIEEYKRYISKNKNERLAQYAIDRIAAIYFEQKRYDEAIMEWEKAVNQSSDQNMNAVRTLNIGKTLYLTNKSDEALNRLTPLLSLAGNLPIVSAARIIIGRIYQADGNHAKALALFNAIPEDVLKTAPYSEARYYKALSLINRGEILNAKSQLQIFLAIVQDEPLRFNALYELGLLNMRSGETERGLDQLNEAKKTDDPALRLSVNKYLGNYYMDKNPSLARTYLEDSPDTGTSDARDIQILLAKAYITEKRFTDAEKILSLYQTKYPYDKNIDQVKFLTARIYIEKKQTENAAAIFEDLKQNYPFFENMKEIDLYTAMGCYNDGDYQRAVNLLNVYLKRNDIESRYDGVKLMAESYIAMNNLNMARTYVNMVVNNYINKAGAVDVIFLFAVSSTEKNINAAWYISIVLEKFPDSEQALKLCLFLGDNAFKAGRYQNAIDYYDRYLKGNRRESKGVAFYNKTVSMYNLKKYNELISMLSSGAIPPMDEDQWMGIHFILARCYNEMGMQGMAYFMLSESDAKIMPDDVLFIFLKSAVHFGDIQLVLRNLDYVKNNKNASEITYLIASYYATNSAEENAVKYYAMVIDKYPESEKADFARYEHAKILLNRNDANNAARRLKEITNKSLNDDKNALLILCYFSAGEDAAAAELSAREIGRLSKKESYEQILKLNLVYYYNLKNTAMFNRFSSYLKAAAKDQLYVNYICGKYYYEVHDYPSSFAYFGKIADYENEYNVETWFYLGEINLLINKKQQQAVQYFERVIANDNESDYAYKARIELALIYNETSRKEEALDILKEIINRPKKKMIYAIQAENLYNSFKDDIRQN
ncbi:MAG: tetratricopeptide repeat protein [Leptospirales bacterium]|nr:tetratricopeptide repeat protein [Leptospirales bacterium]